MRTNHPNAVWDNCSLLSSTSGDTDGIVAVRTAMGQWRHGQSCSAGSVAVRTVGDAYQPPKCSVGQLLLALSHQWGHRWDSGGADSDGTVAVRTEGSAGSVAVRTVGDAYQPPKCSVGQLLLALSHQWGHRWDSGGADSGGTVAVRTGVLSWISGGADSGGCVPTNQIQCGTIAPCSLPPVGTQMG
jgi:hypothetical protein